MTLKRAVLEEVETYFLHHQNTTAHYIMTCLILELYLEADRRPGGAGSIEMVVSGALYL